MEKHARTKLGKIARGWRKASVLHRFPLIWVDLVYVWYLSVRSDDTAHFLCVTLIMVIHADLYLLATRTTFYAASSLPYLCVQGLLALILGFVAGNWLVALGLYLALAVKIVELLERAEPGPGQVLAYVLLFALASLLDVLQASRTGISGLSWTYLAPFLVCVAAAVLLFLRQAHARLCMQRLLHHLRDGYDELFASHTELTTRHAHLSASVVEIEESAQEGERQRLARELHDTLTQDLVSLVMQLEAVDARLASEQPQRAREIVQLTIQRARATLSETRRAIYDLRAPASERGDLIESARAEMRRFSQATGIPCRGDLRLLATVPAFAGEQLVQALKEGLTNVARHAHAHEVWIGLRRSGATFEVEICDDGQGFDPERVMAGHYGLLGLRERAQQLGGELRIQSAPGTGTRLSISLPWWTEEQEVCAV